MAETFNQIKKPEPSHRLGVYDWVSEKATDYSNQAHKYLQGKSKTELAFEGATLAVGVAGSVLLHRNLMKPGLGAEVIKATESEAKSVFGGAQHAAAEAAHAVDFRMPPPPPPMLESAPASPGQHIALPRGMTVEDIPTKPPFLMPTEALPYPGSKTFNAEVADRLNVRLDLQRPNSIGILHARFRNPEKQLEMIQHPDHNVSLYGNKELGVGVLEYEAKPSARPYFKNADSVVQIKFWGKSHGVGTGTLISHDGLIATAGHVVPSGRRITVDTLHGQFDAKVVAIKFDHQDDMAAIKIIGAPRRLVFPVPEMTSAHLSHGMRTSTVGHTQGMTEQFASLGSYIRDLNFTTPELSGRHPAFFLDTIMPGNSGGPIFDAHGNFAAILANRFLPEEDGAFANSHRAIAFGNRIEDLHALLRQRGISFGA